MKVPNIRINIESVWYKDNGSMSAYKLGSFWTLAMAGKSCQSFESPCQFNVIANFQDFWHS